MSELVAFVLARIAEDEAAARAASYPVGQWRRAGINSVEDTDERLVIYGDGPSPNGSQADHIARHDPARVLAECAAKRRIVEHCLPYVTAGTAVYGMVAAVANRVLYLLVQPYEGADGWDEAWKVET